MWKVCAKLLLFKTSSRFLVLTSATLEKPQQCPAAGDLEITVHCSSAGEELHTLWCIWTQGPACREYQNPVNKKCIKHYSLLLLKTSCDDLFDNQKHDKTDS